MRYISASLRQQVIARAANHCEYCGLSQLGQAATFHIDRVTPLAAGGKTTEDNLADTFNPEKSGNCWKFLSMAQSGMKLSRQMWRYLSKPSTKC